MLTLPGFVGSLLGSTSLTLMPRDTPEIVFAGPAQPVDVSFRNPTSVVLESDLRFRVFQVGSVTAVPLDEARPWKRLTVLAGQTVLETLILTLPGVRAETRFRVQWSDERGHIVGTTEVVAAPPDLLRGLGALAGDPPPGVFDPHDQLKPLLRRIPIRFEDLDLEGLERYRGRLVIACSDRTGNDDLPPLVARLRKCWDAGVNVLWFRHPEPMRSGPLPLCLVRPGSGTLVAADAQGLATLEQSAAQQRTLIPLAGLAVKPESSILFPP